MAAQALKQNVILAKRFGKTESVSINLKMTNNINLDLETKVIERFVVKKKRARYLGFIKIDKNRCKFTNELAHFRDLQQDLFEEVKGHKSLVIERIKNLVKLKECYLISESSKFDQKKLDIDIALTEIIGCSMGTLIVFGDADIVYYEGEGPSDSWIGKPTKFILVDR